MYIVIAILAFGFLIIIHEFGHYMAAKAFGVRVIEFSIGMGPRLLKKQGKETLFSLRALPIGGSCMMEGEDEEMEDPRSFTAQARWKRFIILFAGSFMNFLTGAVIVLILVSQSVGFLGNTITGLAEGFPHEGEKGITAGDKIISINGERVYYADDFLTFMALYGDKPVDMVVLRDGAKVTLNDLPLQPRDYVDENGATVRRYGVNFNRIDDTLGQKLKYTGYRTMNLVRFTRISLSMLFSGSAGFNDLSGPVGIVSAINDVGQDPEASTSEKLFSVANFIALIAVTLAVMNLLPIPALDGGRIFFMIVTFFIEKISRKHVDPKYEGYIHTAGFLLLLGLMAVVMINDVVKLFNG